MINNKLLNKRFVKKLVLTLPFAILNLFGILINSVLQILKSQHSNLWIDYMYKKSREKFFQVSHTSQEKEVQIEIFTPNSMTEYRARTFSTKEPDTLDWLDRHSDEKVLLDIGANVGLYTLYFGKIGRRVIALECSPLNIGELVRNINLNNLQDQVTVIPIALSSREEIGEFFMGSEELGAAESSFGNETGFDGNGMRIINRFTTISMSLDELYALYPNLDKPNLMKIDVDGNESAILEGASRLLDNNQLVSILCEVNPNSPSRNEKVASILSSYGFGLERQQTGNNQIWNRNL